jgi:hypothetical protein
MFPIVGVPPSQDLTNKSINKTLRASSIEVPSKRVFESILRVRHCVLPVSLEWKESSSRH